MAIRIKHVEITFAPGSILRRVWTESVFREVRPNTVNIGDVEDQPPPAYPGIPLFKV